MPVLEYIRNLFCDVLGPRNADPEEILEVNPSSEFITGVLSPPVPTKEGKIMEKAEESDIGVGDLEEDVGLLSAKTNPVLNPERRPASMGLDFTLEADEDRIEFDILVTWGRYFPENEKKKKRWKRRSFFREEKIVLNLNHESPLTVPLDDGIELKIFVKRNEDNRYHVSVYLINRTAVPEQFKDRKTPPAEYMIFQPQIRLKLYNARVSRASVSNMNCRGEEAIYEFPFVNSGLPVHVRGRMCAAIWKEVDPLQNGSPEEINELVKFMWPDGKRLPEDTYRKFIECDIRTEFVPVVPQAEPDFSVNNIEFNPDKLAELSPQNIRKTFTPLIEKYSEWIEKLRVNLPGSCRDVAERIVHLHTRTLERIKKGINILAENRDALLSFNFTNRVMTTVQEWTGKKFSWRPFQIAFLLMVLESLVNSKSEDRKYMDVIWVPTGGGKTEAYLATSVFLLAYRRRRKDIPDYGTAIISRYTLRMLTIQQFTRTLKTITACEYLRNHPGKNGEKGWTPEWFVTEQKEWIWGKVPFSVGLWVGGGVTPNKLHGSFHTKGALELLKDKKANVALVTQCPTCGEILSIPREGIKGKEAGEGIAEFKINLITRLSSPIEPRDIKNLRWGKEPSPVKNPDIDAEIETAIPIDKKLNIYCFRFYIVTDKGLSLKPEHIEELWDTFRERLKNIYGITAELLSVAPYRPGYFTWGRARRPKAKPVDIDFTIRCPNPECPLNRGINNDGWKWSEYIPSENGEKEIFSTAEYGEFSWMKKLIPVPALFIDEQIYARLPSMVISTVDKFARLPFEPATGALFGNVEYFNPSYGFFRGEPLYSNRPDIGNKSFREKNIKVEKAAPPELIIQDELHLIEGPLGSLTGLYETAVETLCSEAGSQPKYISSSATVKLVSHQTEAVFARKAHLFPPPGLRIDDSFFLKLKWQSLAESLRESQTPGKIYIGIMAPGRGPLTPQRNVFSVLWKTRREQKEETPVVGYYNAIRELAGGKRLIEQDVRQRIKELGMNDYIPDILELSSRIDSDELSLILSALEEKTRNPDFIITTSIFGTGIDIPYLKLMVVNGQPKTTSEYIQATGRVGRREKALVTVLYRSTRPRDVSHYEFFAGYHTAIYRSVEATPVYPFSRGCVIRGHGPVLVSILRNSRKTREDWIPRESAVKMKDYDSRATIKADVNYAAEKLIERNNAQRDILKYPDNIKHTIMGKEGITKWKEMARTKNNLVFNEYATYNRKYNPVVLGDIEHEKKGDDFVVYLRVPQSLRSIEENIDIDIFHF
jgi:hypothetical protein